MEQTQVDTVRPEIRPACNRFMSGPCAKRPGYALGELDVSLLGRSRRADALIASRYEVIKRSSDILKIPLQWRLAIVPGSDMGAMEMALWSLLGPRPVDVIAFERFSNYWAEDVVDALRLPHARVFRAPFGELPDLSLIDSSHDVVFVWNGTTSGVCIPDADWIPAERTGLAICDATSAAFAMPLPWEKLDVVTWSWQKAMGGEGAHGMLALSPRALERLQTYRPTWPIPRLLRLAEDGKIIDSLFQGGCVNTPSQLCVEDALDGLRWAEEIGGLDALLTRTRANAVALNEWVARTPWIEHLVADEKIRSLSSICLSLCADWYLKLDAPTRARAAARLCSLLEEEKVAYDIDANPSAPPGIRIWCGPTVETADIEALLPWLEWAHESVERSFSGLARTALSA